LLRKICGLYRRVTDMRQLNRVSLSEVTLVGKIGYSKIKLFFSNESLKLTQHFDPNSRVSWFSS